MVVAALEAFAAGHARLEPRAELELHLVEPRPDFLVPVGGVADEVGAHEVARIAAIHRAHVDLHEVADLHRVAGRERAVRGE